MASPDALTLGAALASDENRTALRATLLQHAMDFAHTHALAVSAAHVAALCDEILPRVLNAAANDRDAVRARATEAAFLARNQDIMSAAARGVRTRVIEWVRAREALYSGAAYSDV